MSLKTMAAAFSAVLLMMPQGLMAQQNDLVAQAGETVFAPMGGMADEATATFSVPEMRMQPLTLAADTTPVKVKQKVPKDWSTWKPEPKRALWLALVLPGAGQIYNRKYWKLPIFYGGVVGCIYAMTWNNQMYHDYAQAYMDIMDNNDATQSYNQFLHLGNKITEENKARYTQLFKKRKDRYRRWRDLSVFSMIGVYALSVIDAYVDASLSDFDISKDLTLHVAPSVISTSSSASPTRSSGVGVGCSLTF